MKARTGDVLPIISGGPRKGRQANMQDAEAGQNQSEAARRLGISRATLIDKLKRFELID